ncbi:hypothetical protein CLV78_101138 [Aliiruegeria haliotis]|uniref:Uncharacterized protein n=1 Tax=Aliiruegeria haliotis TaxID=1280846 RepID=A0A2T0RXY7_9RHOB|nr:hypothetical protein [Aliiruegeria haliotis]PRY26045.1 hypothetical protein CLV78_101138 [Aliiruegeria haliotis]
MTTYREELFALYSVCSDAALERILSRHEVDHCYDVYIRLKLSFVKGVTLEQFKAMPAASRTVANTKGYTAYRAWLHSRITHGR